MTAPSAENLKIKVFADGADLKNIRELAANPQIKGFTTNPTLMRAAGVEDYKSFAHDVLSVIGDRPVSFEVFADDFATMEAQAREIASWGENVYVKIPITNTKGDFSGPLIATLSRANIKLNVTAVMTLTHRRWLPFWGIGGAAVTALVALGDVGGPARYFAVELTLAAGGLLVSLASFAGLLRDAPRDTGSG